MLPNLRAILVRTMDKQPKGAGVIYFAEFMGRFGFYGLISLFILYLTEGLQFNESFSYDILAVLLATAYILPILGGLLSSYILGYQRGIIFGGFVLAFGLSVAAFSGTDRHLLFIGLSLFTIGNGIFQPSSLSLLGSLYKTHEPHRESGFTYYQMCLTGGTVAAGLMCGYIAQRLGFNAGFGLAGIGVLIGTIVFIFLRKRFAGCGKVTVDHERPWLCWLQGHPLLTVIVTVVLISMPISQLFLHRDIVQGILIITSFIIFAIIIYLTSKRWLIDGKNILVFIPIALMFIAFESLIRQSHGMLTEFAEHFTRRSYGHFTIPAPWFFSLEPLFVLLLGAIFAKIWVRLYEQFSGPAFPIKFTASFIFMSISFALLALGVYLNTATNLVSSLWLVLAYLFQAASELSFMPIALAILTRLIPKDLLGFVMGCLFLTVGIGVYSSAIIAKHTAVTSADVVQTASQHFLLYGEVFRNIAIAAFLTAIVIIVCSPLLNWLFSDKKVVTH